jgi:pyruvate dehydrogenase E1 component beta subunit
MFGGKVTIPLTIMTGIGAGTNSAAQHSETLYSIFTHFPGLKCVVPSNPYNAKGLMIAAIRDDDPVIVFNNRQLMGLRFDDEVPEDEYTVEIGKSDIKQTGDDITLIGIGFTTRVCMEAADELEDQGYSVEVLDLLSLSPMDNDAIVSSVQKTRKVVIVDEDYPRCSIATDIAALVAEEAFDYLDAPPRRVTPPHTSVPYSRPLEALFVPNKEKVVEAALEILD